MAGFLAFMTAIAVAVFIYHDWRAWRASKTHFDAELERMRLERMMDDEA